MSRRVLIAIHRFSVGGAETQALYLARELQNRGYQIVVGAFGFEEEEGYLRFVHSGLECVYWGFKEKVILEDQKGIIGQIRKYKYVFKLLFQVRGLKIDYIIPFTYAPNIIFCYWYRWMKVKKCFWNQRDEGRKFSGRSEEIESLNYCSFIISNSLEGSKFLSRYTEREIVHIPNGIDALSFFQSNDTSRSKKVIMIGNIHGYKDHLTLIKAWKLVLNHFPDFRLILAGEKGNKFDDCSSLVKELEIESSVEFKGLVKSVSNTLRGCCLAVFSSENEGLPNGVLEPMAAGLAVVASNIKGTREALGEEYKFLVDSQDPNLFADQIIRLLCNDQLRKKVGHDNFLRVFSNFSIESMVNQYETLLNGKS